MIKSSFLTLSLLLASPAAAYQTCIIAPSDCCDTLSLHSAPAGPIIGYMPPGSAIRVTQVAKPWVYVVSWDGFEGWVWGNNVGSECLPPPPPPDCGADIHGCPATYHPQPQPQPRIYHEHEKGHFQPEEPHPEAPMPDQNSGGYLPPGYK